MKFFYSHNLFIKINKSQILIIDYSNIENKFITKQILFVNE